MVSASGQTGVFVKRKRRYLPPHSYHVIIIQPILLVYTYRDRTDCLHVGIIEAIQWPMVPVNWPIFTALDGIAMNTDCDSLEGMATIK